MTSIDLFSYEKRPYDGDPRFSVELWLSDEEEALSVMFRERWSFDGEAPPIALANLPSGHTVCGIDTTDLVANCVAKRDEVREALERREQCARARSAPSACEDGAEPDSLSG